MSNLNIPRATRQAENESPCEFVRLIAAREAWLRGSASTATEPRVSDGYLRTARVLAGIVLRHFQACPKCQAPSGGCQCPVGREYEVAVRALHRKRRATKDEMAMVSLAQAATELQRADRIHFQTCETCQKFEARLQAAAGVR